MTVSAPRWDLTNVYPSLESRQFRDAMKEYKRLLDVLEKYHKNKLSKAGAKTSARELGSLLGKAVDQFNAIFELGRTLHAYLDSFFTTDSHNKTAARQLSQFEQVQVRENTLRIQFTAWVGTLGKKLEQAVEKHPSAKAHAFALKEARDRARYLMSEAEERLAAELSLSGGNAFEKLQGTVTSQLSVDFDLDGKIQKLSMPMLINLRTHPDEATRRRAYEAENAVWESARETLAACLNGIKGETNVLWKKRGRKDALHSAIDAARIDRKTLDAMTGAMKDSLPMFRKYFKAKAKKLGKEQLAWWDIFAPIGRTEKTYSFDEARDFILTYFGGFSPDLHAMTATAFKNNWIDAEPREGKRGGAFCMSLPAVRESRILSNYNGSFNGVSTLAHELGHAFHGYCAFKAGRTELQRSTPMTLAETASIMCETIVTQAVLAAATDTQEELAMLEAQIQNAGQVIVDIYSRFLFEKEVFERREQAELSADEFCEIMERAQKAAYGDGLDERYLQKYMWTWKPHYYDPNRPFYNFPYAFGLLFATGLYAIYRQRGAGFVPDYMDLLASTGEDTAAKLAKRFGIDITKRRFWDDSLAIIGKQIDRFCALSGTVAFPGSAALQGV
jgi:oligoendopeptidase F